MTVRRMVNFADGPTDRQTHEIAHGLHMIVPLYQVKEQNQTVVAQER